MKQLFNIHLHIKNFRHEKLLDMKLFLCPSYAYGLPPLYVLKDCDSSQCQGGGERWNHRGVGITGPSSHYEDCLSFVALRHHFLNPGVKAKSSFTTFEISKYVLHLK